MSVTARLRDADPTSGCPVAVDTAETAAALLEKVHAALDLPRAIEDYDVVVKAGDAEEVRIEDPAALLSAVGVVGAFEVVVVSLKLKFVAREQLRLRGIADAEAAEAALAAAWGRTPRDDGAWDTIRLVASAGYSSLKDHLHEAVAQGELDTADRLLGAGADPDAKDEKSMTPLAVSAKLGHYELVKFLLSKDASIDYSTPQVPTPLCEAARGGHTRVAELLLAHGAAVEGVSAGLIWFTLTPLQYAAGEGHLETAKMLLAHGAKIPQHMLIMAATGGHVEVMKLLLDNGVDINALDSYKTSALSKAVRFGRREAVELLLARGADITLADYDNRTAGVHAKLCGHVEIAQMLGETMDEE